MEITCPRCGFTGQSAFAFKINPRLALFSDRPGSGSSTDSSDGTAQPPEMGEYTACPQCISVYAVTTTTGENGNRVQPLTLLTAERLRRFSPEAQERLRVRLEKYIVEHLRNEERRRMRLRDLTFSFAALSQNHPFHEALTRLKNRGVIHTWEDDAPASASSGMTGQTETMVMLV